MIDIVFPLGNGSRYNDWELKMTLRTIEANMSNVGKVFCVGNYPSWASPDLIHIKWEQSGGKAFRIFYKMLLATDVCSDKFIGWSDDTPLLVKMDADKLPVYTNKTLEHWASLSINYEYLKIVRSTHKLFPDGKFYNVHTPALYEKDKFQSMWERVDWRRDQYLVKSTYFNLFPPEETIEISDPKIVAEKLPDAPFISFPSSIPVNLMRILEEKYPNKSRWEK